MTSRGCCRIRLLRIWFVSHSNGSMERSEWRERENGPRREREECVGEWGEEREREGGRRRREGRGERERCDEIRWATPRPSFPPVPRERRRKGGGRREERGGQANAPDGMSEWYPGVIEGRKKGMEGEGRSNTITMRVGSRGMRLPLISF